MRRLAYVVFVLCTLLFSGNILFAQFDTGGIVGLVKDSSGAAVQGAKMTLTDPATGSTATTVTNESGNYEFPNLRVGLYKVTAEKTGFSIAAAENVVVSISTRTRVDLGLAVGEVSQTVEVQGTTPLVESDTSGGLAVQFANWFLGCLLIYATLFAIGKIIFKEYFIGIAFAVAAIIAGALISWNLSRVGWKSAGLPKEESSLEHARA